MKIKVVDSGKGIAQQLATAIGAKIRGRFIEIPPEKGGGYITGFGWGSDLRMMIRHYFLHEAVLVERINELAEDQEDLVFQFSGVFPSLTTAQENARLMICRHAVSAIMDMPAETGFGNVTIAISRSYLNQLFGHISHPVLSPVLTAQDNFVVETRVTPAMIATANAMLGEPVPKPLEDHYFKLKCEELLNLAIAQLLQRSEAPAIGLHIDDIKAIYAVKTQLQNHLSEPPHIAQLAKQAHMSEPKLRKLFRQTFGKSVFDYYQTLRMQQAARLLREQHFSVSQTGYQLGFTNLSHFARTFQQHHGLKPKKYAAQALIS